MQADVAATFGQTLRTLRMSVDMSLRELARRVGVSAGYLSQVESGQLTPPTEERLCQIAEALGLATEDLLRLSGRVDAGLTEWMAEVPESQELLEALRGIEAPGSELAALAALLRERGRGWLTELLSEAPTGSGLGAIFRPARVFPKLVKRTRRTLFQALVEAICDDLPAAQRARLVVEDIVSQLEAREERSPTLIGERIAMPHTAVAGLEGSEVAVARLPRALSFVRGAPETKVQLVVLVLHGPESRAQRISLLADIARRLSQRERRAALLEAPCAASMIELLAS